MTTPSMALLDLVFLGVGGIILALLHTIHPHEPMLPLTEGNEDVHEEGEEHESHTGTYLGIFAGLCVLTAVELAVPAVIPTFFYVLVTSLVVLAFAKAGLVGLNFMHLKDEDSSVFVWLIISIIGILLMLAGIVWDISVVYGSYV